MDILEVDDQGPPIPTMKRIWILAGVIVAVAIMSLWARPLTWFRSYGVCVTYNGNPAPDARVYRHRGDIFVDLRVASALPYIIRSQDKFVGIPGNSFFATTGLVALARMDPVPVVDMRSAKNDSKDPMLSLTRQSATFVDNDGRFVRLAW
jgi:hypothetical protein